MRLKGAIGTLPDARQPPAAQDRAQPFSRESVSHGLRRIRVRVLERALIGNTAEQLLRFLPCDLLILKPPEFVCRVPAAQRGAQQISAPPLS